MQINRILQVIGTLNVGGSQSFIINLYKNIDRSKVQFDFILDHNDEKDLRLVPIVKELGAKVYFLPTFKGWNFLEIIKTWHKFFRHHPEYKIIHSHVRSYATIFLTIAKKHGLKTIIHSHSTFEGEGISSFVKRVLEFPLRFIADYFFACSDEAGKWLFGNGIVSKTNYKVIPNGIDVNLFKYNQKIRKEYRNKFKIDENTKVYVHVGRFHPAKNHEFLINVFNRICKLQSNSIMLLVGDGTLKKNIEKQVNDLKLSSKVKFLGNRSDVHNLLQVADCFVFPSKWEGLPVTVVEAQASGLPCMISSNITNDVSISKLVRKLPIDKGIDCWIDALMNATYERVNVTEKICIAGFDVCKNSKLISDFYNEITANNSIFSNKEKTKLTNLLGSDLL